MQYLFVVLWRRICAVLAFELVFYDGPCATAVIWAKTPKRKALIGFVRAMLPPAMLANVDARRVIFAHAAN